MSVCLSVKTFARIFQELYVRISANFCSRCLGHVSVLFWRRRNVLCMHCRYNYVYFYVTYNFIIFSNCVLGA